MIRRKLLLLSLILLSINMASCQTKDYREKLESLYNHTVPLINSSKLSEGMDKGKQFILLDIRSNEEYQVSHLPGAKLVEYENFDQKIVKSIPLDAEIVVYCSVGYRSEKIGEQLIDLGYSDVKNLYGGIFQWKNEGYAVINPDALETDSVHTYNRKWSKWLKKGVKVY